jgi:uncharacterized repeat protein (TIGR01451 family)
MMAVTTWRQFRNFLARNARAARPDRGKRPALEILEDRRVPTGWLWPRGLTPSDIRTAYGINGTGLDGAGQTIAIVDNYDDPNIQTDLTAFCGKFDLPFAGVRKVNAQGQSSPLPAESPTSGKDNWAGEEALDVEWAHAIAPQANLILVEVDPSGDLYAAAQMAAGLPGVSVVSMSFGESEFGGEGSSDSDFQTPAGHTPVTFVASAGDDGIPGDYPAFSRNVVAVGGTRLALGDNGSYASEARWAKSGGGISSAESEPDYQQGVQNSGQRSIPDVSFDGDPSSGVAVFDSHTNGLILPWANATGGTSLGAPVWAGLIALANQARANHGLAPLDGVSQTLPRLYQLPSSAFHKVPTSIPGLADPPNITNYNYGVGLGSPVANQLVPDLAGVPTVLAQPLRDNNFVLKVNNGRLELTDNGVLEFSLPVNSVDVVDIQGSVGYNNIATIDYSGGVFPATVHFVVSDSNTSVRQLIIEDNDPTATPHTMTVTPDDVWSPGAGRVSGIGGNIQFGPNISVSIFGSTAASDTLLWGEQGATVLVTGPNAGILAGGSGLKVNYANIPFLGAQASNGTSLPIQITVDTANLGLANGVQDSIVYAGTDSTFTLSINGRVEVGGIIAPTTTLNLTGHNEDDWFTISGTAVPTAFDAGAGSSAALIYGGSQATYQPTGPASSRVILDNVPIALQGPTHVGFSGTSSLTLQTPDATNVLSFGPWPVGVSVVGTSNGTSLPQLTFTGVPSVTVDTASHDNGSAPGDNITVSAGGLSAAGLQNLKINTGPSDDTLEIDSPSYTLPTAGGAITFNGGGGRDTFVGNASGSSTPVGYTLSDSGVSSSAGGTVQFSGIGYVQLTGGSGADTFTVNGWSGHATLTGGGGGDTVVESAAGSATPVNFTLANYRLSSSLGTAELSGVGNVQLTGGSGADTFTVNGWSGLATLTGGGGGDTVVESAAGSATPVNFTLTNTQLSSSLGTVQLSGIPLARLTGGNGSDTFSVSSWSGQATLDGGPGNDQYQYTVGGGGQVAIWDKGPASDYNQLTINGDNGGDRFVVRANVISLSGLSDRVITSQGVSQLDLQGGSGADSFQVAPSASMLIRVHGNGPGPSASPGDSLSLDLSPVTGTSAVTGTSTVTSTLTPSGYQGFFGFSNLVAVTFDTLETLPPATDVSVSETATPANPTPGGTLTYTITISNASPTNAQTVTLTDAIPAGTSFVSSTLLGFRPDRSQTILGDLRAGASITGTLVVRVLNSGTVTNSVSVGSVTPDANSANNSTAVTTTVAAFVPQVNIGPDVNLPPGGTLNMGGSFVDPSTDTWTATVDYGDGGGRQPLTLSGHNFALNHTYPNVGDYRVTVTVTDREGVSGTGTFVTHVFVAGVTGVSGGGPVTGSAQHSMITSLVYTFTTQVDIAPGAFQLIRHYAGMTTDVSGLLHETTALNSAGQTVVTLTFSGPGVVAGSLPDGRYTFIIHGKCVTDHRTGKPMAGDGHHPGTDYVDQWFRLYGDMNGDGKVDATDLVAFLAAYRSKKGAMNYNASLDYNGDCAIDNTDLYQFVTRYGTSV